MWKVNYIKLIKWLVPHWLRNPCMMIFMMAANIGVRRNYDVLQKFIGDTDYRLAHNSQVCYLRAVLNDAFDTAQRRILIEDFDGLQRIYLWPEIDRRDIDITTAIYLWPDSMYADSGIDFTIKVPYAVNISGALLDYFKSLVNKYKLPGKNYNIVRI